MKSTSAILKIKELCVEFATPQGILKAVRGVDFTVNRGEVVGIVGESGSGKSVTAQAILNLLPPNGRINRGSIEYDNQDVIKYDKDLLRSYRGGQVSMIFQEPGRSFDPIYSIGKAMEETILAHFPTYSRKQAQEKAMKLLTEVNIPNAGERLKNYPHQFSGGMLQRIMIAIALVSDPHILIADEPTTALDVTIQAQIVELLAKIQQARKISIIFISHNLALIANIADSIQVMYGGLIMESGKTSLVLKTPQHPYTKALLGSMPRFGDHYTQRQLATIAGTVPDPLYPERGCPFAPRCTEVIPDCLKSVPPVYGDEMYCHRCLVAGEKEKA